MDGADLQYIDGHCKQTVRKKLNVALCALTISICEISTDCYMLMLMVCSQSVCKHQQPMISPASIVARSFPAHCLIDCIIGSSRQ